MALTSRIANTALPDPCVPDATQRRGRYRRRVVEVSLFHPLYLEVEAAAPIRSIPAGVCPPRGVAVTPLLQVLRAGGGRPGLARPVHRNSYIERQVSIL